MPRNVTNLPKTNRTGGPVLLCLDLPDEEALKATIAGDCATVDVTEQPIERPQQDQNQYY